MAVDRRPALLVKAPAAALSADRLGASSSAVEIEPLFQHIPPERSPDLGVAGRNAAWHRLTLADADEGNLWDLCHNLNNGEGFGAAGRSVFAEPDLWQSWNHPLPPVDFGAAATCATTASPQSTDHPKGTPDLWFRDVAHAGFDAITGTTGPADVGQGSRIAHIDTGYDPHHATRPVHIREDLERNFVERDRPNSAKDISEGIWVQDGHGAGTVAILAGPQYGGAPGAEIVPLRIADRVVLFRNSALAQALDYIYGLRNDPNSRIDVVTMSMGGVASRAWAEAVNRLYETGVFIVTAAGNNWGNLPTRNIVFPARFRRVVAACGVMADLSPYTDRGPQRMAGNYGPDSKMATALSAFTPNVPWAVGGCGTLVNHDGQGTSCGTPQIAAAAAIWIARNRAALAAYPHGWMKVEAVRHALFDSAEPGHRHLGRGALQADRALATAPPATGDLRQSPSANADFPLLRLLTGLGVAGAAPERLAMLELEALQLSQSEAVENLLPDPDHPPESLTPEARRRILEALADQPGASRALKAFLAPGIGGSSAGGGGPAGGAPPTAAARDMAAIHLGQAIDPPVRAPASRKVRVYAFDPSLSASQDTAAINIATLDLPWEPDLKPGPVGEYLEVVDVDPASDAAYAPVDLNHPHLLGQQGLAPTPADPRFHQQMVYAVAMKTIGHFERALGRTALWGPRWTTPKSETFVRRLRVYPHAFRGANAYYSPDRKALLFGYFPAEGDWRDTPGGQITFTCLSHDIIAHETTHALLDGLHPRYREPTNPDVLAFHEAFADLVALFQHFTLTEAVEHQIAASRGDLGQLNPLIVLAAEFGRASSRGGEFQTELRRAVDDLTAIDADLLKGDATALPIQVHDRGAQLMAAVFDAFLKLYKARHDDLILLATGGTGVLPQGRLSAPLIKALAKEAGKLAGQMMSICIRALDYCPPVDVTFGDYLRAMITADRDVVPDDPRGYRLALIAGFTKRGIFPQNVPHLSPASMVWEAPPIPITSVAVLLPTLDLGWNRSADREKAWATSRDNARRLHAWLTGRAARGKPPPAVTASAAELEALGLFRTEGRHTVPDPDNPGATVQVTVRGIEVHSVRPARRAGPDGLTRSDLVVEITQSWQGPDGVWRRGGCTILFDLETFEARYLIRKRVANISRMRMDASASLDAVGDTLRETYFRAAGDREPFAMLHRCY